MRRLAQFLWYRLPTFALFSYLARLTRGYCYQQVKKVREIHCLPPFTCSPWKKDKVDYCKHPAQFEKESGDCEDFSCWLLTKTDKFLWHPKRLSRLYPRGMFRVIWVGGGHVVPLYQEEGNGAYFYFDIRNGNIEFVATHLYPSKIDPVPAFILEDLAHIVANKKERLIYCELVEANLFQKKGVRWF